MKRYIHGWLGLGALLLTGCPGSGSICERMAEVASREKVKDCPAVMNNITLPEDFSVDRCESAFEGCTEEDRGKLEDFLNCYLLLDTCEAATEQEYLSQWNNCVLMSKGTSDACELQ
jgi:hypothetical protein